jgi:hypothetical protein
MTGSVTRRAPDFSGYPDLVVMMLGMHVRTWFGLRTLLGFRKPIELAGAARPEGLLHYENNIVFSLSPTHVGMRWYWRNMASLDLGKERAAPDVVAQFPEGFGRDRLLA